MANPVMERRIVRVLVSNDVLLQGLNLGPETVLCQIVPAVDRYEFGMQHWLFFADPSFPVNERGCLVREYRMLCTDNDEGGRDIEMVPA